MGKKQKKLSQKEKQKRRNRRKNNQVISQNKRNNEEEVKSNEEVEVESAPVAEVSKKTRRKLKRLKFRNEGQFRQLIRQEPKFAQTVGDLINHMVVSIVEDQYLDITLNPFFTQVS